MITATPRPTALLLALLLPFHLSAAPGDAELPAAAIPVSPGDGQAGTQVADTCPSFSWGAVTGAQGYELAIFDAHWNASPVYAEQLSQGHPLARIAIEAPALSWTPAGGDCLAAGGRYVWFVRARFAAGEGDWSAPRYFEIDYDADALTQAVRRELAAQLRQPEVWREVIQAALSGNRTLALTPLASAALMPAAATDTATRAGGTGATSGWENSAISPQVTTFPNPSALKINSPNGVVFNRSATGGGIPAEGDGARFMWYPGKAALRAGIVSGAQWDDTNIGIFSTALGTDTTAIGPASVAMGIGTFASQNASIALGNFTTASGFHATAMGSNTTSSSFFSTAMGLSTTASSLASTAMGSSTTASGSASTALGFLTAASGAHSLAMGESTTASGESSTALGIKTIASGAYSVAMGEGTLAESGYETTIGRYNIDYTPINPTGWDPEDRLFVIGNGTSAAARGRSNAMVVLKNGNVGIGISKPEYRLQLLSDSAAKPGTNTWTVASDARLKDITGPYESGLTEIAALQAVRYHYAVNNARGHDPEPEYVGFIAQQAQAVFPEAVSEGADGYLDFNMHAVNVAMVNAIQTLREQNLALEAQLQAQAVQFRTQQAQLQAQTAQIDDLWADKLGREQRLADQEHRTVARAQCLATLAAEQEGCVNLHLDNARLESRLVEMTKLHRAEMATLQAQMRTLQGQMASALTQGYVALER